MNFFDCHGGPGTTEPACGACVTCLHRVIESKDAENAALQKRIQRLEEAGNAMDPWCNDKVAVDAWREAMESKP